MIFCHLPVLQCANFIHYVLSLVHWALLFIRKTNEISTFPKYHKHILSSMLTSIFAPFESSWGHLGATLGPPWVPFWTILGPLGVMLWALGAILGPLWSILDASWNLLEAILIPLAPTWSFLLHLDAFGEVLWDHLVSFGCHLGAIFFILD